METRNKGLAKLKAEGDALQRQGKHWEAIQVYKQIVGRGHCNDRVMGSVYHRLAIYHDDACNTLPRSAATAPVYNDCFNRLLAQYGDLEQVRIFAIAYYQDAQSLGVKWLDLPLSRSYSSASNPNYAYHRSREYFCNALNSGCVAAWMQLLHQSKIDGQTMTKIIDTTQKPTVLQDYQFQEVVMIKVAPLLTLDKFDKILHRTTLSSSTQLYCRSLIYRASGDRESTHLFLKRIFKFNPDRVPIIIGRAANLDLSDDHLAQASRFMADGFDVQIDRLTALEYRLQSFNYETMEVRPNFTTRCKKKYYYPYLPDDRLDQIFNQDDRTKARMLRCFDECNLPVDIHFSVRGPHLARFRLELCCDLPETAKDNQLLRDAILGSCDGNDAPLLPTDLCKLVGGYLPWY